MIVAASREAYYTKEFLKKCIHYQFHETIGRDYYHHSYLQAVMIKFSLQYNLNPCWNIESMTSSTLLIVTPRPSNVWGLQNEWSSGVQIVL